MKIQFEEAVDGMGRVQLAVDDDNFTRIQFWKPGNDGRPDVLMEMSPAVGPNIDNMLAQAKAMIAPDVPGRQDN